MTTVRSLCVVLLLLLPGAATAATKAAPEKAGDRSTVAKLYEGMEFRNIGPFRGGRVTAVAGVRGQPLVYYQGATGGGVWKTTDGGSNWQAVSDKDFRTGSVGAIAVAESDPNVVYAGMGEAPIRGQRLPRRRRLQVHRRRKDVEKRRPDRHAPDLPRPGPPAGRRPRLRRRPRPRLGAQRRARDLPLEGRRPDLGEGPLREQPDGRLRPLHGPEQPADPLRRVLAGPPEAVVPRVGRPRGWALPLDRRRRQLEEARGRPSGGGRRKHRGGGVRRAARARSGRSSRPRRAASIVPTTAGRSGPASTPRTSCASGPGTTRRSTRTRERRDRLRSQRRLPPFQRRRQDLLRDPRPSRRQPRPLDRSGRSPADDQRQTTAARPSPSTAEGPGPRSTISRPPSSTASRRTTGTRTGSTARSRTTRPSRSRAAAGEGRSGSPTGIRSGVARAAGSRRGPATRRWSTRAPMGGTSRGTTTGRDRSDRSLPGLSSVWGRRQRT